MRRLDGDHDVPTSKADREEIVRRLHAQGCNDLEIERRTGLSDRTVLRTRQTLGLESDYHSAPANHGTGFTSRTQRQEAS